jgi:putative chitinase
VPTAKPPTAVPILNPRIMVIASLTAAGITSQKAQANILAQVEAESNFKPRSEQVPRPEKIFSMFGPVGVPGGQPAGGKNKVRFQTLQEAKDIVAQGPEAYFNKVYDGRKNLGNTTPGDGYKYRGRGFLQITGRDAYESFKKYSKIDVVSNPDLLNDPEIAAKAIPWFFLVYKNKKVDQFEDIGSVSSIVGFADSTSAKKREQIASRTLSELSSENSELRKQMGAPTPGTQTTNNVNVAPGATTTQQQNRDVVDDSSPYSRKSKQ